MVDSGEPLATVYVPTLNGGDSLRSCLVSLESQTVSVEVVVADNGSGDGCREMLESEFSGVRRIAFGRNLGFGSAINRAVEAYGQGPVILLNDDAVAEPDFAERLIEAWHGGEATMVAAVMVANDGSIDSAGVIADETLLGTDYLNGKPLSSLDDAPPPFGPTGGGALYDRASFVAVSGFDEEIFLYYEDLDLAARLRQKGGTCRLSPQARARHGFSKTLGAGSVRKYAYTGWSRGYILGRYRILRRPRALFSVIIVEGFVLIGQMATTRSTIGIRARFSGWLVGRRLPARTAPANDLKPLRTINALKAKVARWRSR